MTEYKVHYPSSVKKYSGGIYQHKRTRGVVFEARYGNMSITFESEEEAFEYIKKNNIIDEVPIKNMIREYPDYMEVSISQGKWAKFDKKDLPLIEQYTFYCHKNYVECRNKNKVFGLHNLIMEHTPTKGKMTVDHINRDTLDNRRQNLRIVDMRAQNINKNTQKNNISRTKGVHLTKGAWVAWWKNEEGKSRCKSFSINKYGNEKVKEMAIAYRKYIEVLMAHYAKALVE